MKKILFSLCLFFVFLPALVLAADKKPVTLTIFYGDGCPHCHSEFLFLDKISKDYPNLTINKYEVWYSTSNANLMSEIAKKMNIKNFGVPLTIIGSQTIVGYLDDQTTGRGITDLLDLCAVDGCQDVVGQIISEKNQAQIDKQKNTSNLPETLKVFSFGEVNIKNMSLPLLTVVIGLLDGFNPCAMWILLFLISLLIGTQNKKRMWVLGLAFILTGAVSYFLFMAAWLNVFLFIGYIPIIRAAIGIFAIGSGIFYVYQWWQQRRSCEAIDDKKRGKIMEKLNKIASQDTYLLALFGIIVLSLGINMIELVCSAGLPAIYTAVLTQSKLSSLSYFLYLVLYIFFFILNQLIVFFVAMFTMRSFAISAKYARLTNFVGGIIIFILGVLLIFKPGWIMFG